MKKFRTKSETPLAFSVEGVSMWPTIKPGQTIYVMPAAALIKQKSASWPPQVGAIVVASHPFRRGQSVIKRVVARENGAYTLRGDNWIESEDSETVGHFGVESLLGLIVDNPDPNRSSDDDRIA